MLALGFDEDEGDVAAAVATYDRSGYFEAGRWRPLVTLEDWPLWFLEVVDALIGGYLNDVYVIESISIERRSAILDAALHREGMLADLVKRAIGPSK